jgi:hypothetical protein
MIATIASNWLPQSRLLTTRLQGTVGLDAVEGWRRGLHAALDRIEANTIFKLLSDLSNYEPADLAAHKVMRVVIPQTLANYGLRTALLDLFDGDEIALEKTRGIRCIAVAHVHHDEGKMTAYESKLSRPNERFFSDAEQARTWLLEVRL